jgi:hypothetical protein
MLFPAEHVRWLVLLSQPCDSSRTNWTSFENVGVVANINYFCLVIYLSLFRYFSAVLSLFLHSFLAAFLIFGHIVNTESTDFCASLLLIVLYFHAFLIWVRFCGCVFDLDIKSFCLSILQVWEIVHFYFLSKKVMKRSHSIILPYK